MSKLEKGILVFAGIVMCLSLLVDATLWPLSTLRGTLTFTVLIYFVFIVAIEIIRNRYPAALFLLLAVLCAGLFLLGISAFKESVFRRIVHEVRPLSSMPHDAQVGGQIVIRGKALVWDLDTDALSPAETHLPFALRACLLSRTVTIFLLMPGGRYEKVGVYERSHASAYRQTVDVCALYWPEKKVAGWSSIAAEPPPVKEVYVPRSGPGYGTESKKPEYGDVEKQAAAWIRTLLVENR